jgi:hypothetical protein
MLTVLSPSQTVVSSSSINYPVGYFLVAGGGGGESEYILGTEGNGSGGAGGDVLQNNLIVKKNETYNILIGAGGVPTGGNTIFSNVTAYGGKGGSYPFGGNNSLYNGGAYSEYFINNYLFTSGGGGAGSGSKGLSGTMTITNTLCSIIGGNGGMGTYNSLTNQYYGGGGGGAAGNNIENISQPLDYIRVVVGQGGIGGGGNGSTGYGGGNSGLQNTGGGGGGA